jgi:hypothetical protein
MPTIQEAVRSQVESLVESLLSNQNPRLLTAVGISRKQRHYLKGGPKRLPATEAVLAALILLGKEIVVEGVFPANGSRTSRYSIVAVERREDGTTSEGAQPVQLSLLAGLDFPAGATATIRRAESKGPGRVELQLDVSLRA